MNRSLGSIALAVAAVATLWLEAGAASAGIMSVTYTEPYTISYSAFSSTVNLPQFNPALGTLVQVSINIDGSATGSTDITNTRYGTNRIGSTFSAFAQMSAPGGITSQAYSQQVDMGTNDYTAMQTQSFTAPDTGLNTDNSPLNNMQFPPPITNVLTAGFGDYIGTGTFAAGISGNASFNVSGFINSNISSNQTAGQVSGNVSVTYTYVPEPSTLALALGGCALVAGRFWRRRCREI